MRFQARPIGFVKSSYTSNSCPFKADDLVSEVHIKRRLMSALDGIDDFSHIIVIFWLNRAKKKDTWILKVHPRRDKSLPLTGVFATRSPVRPTAIGVSTVELIKREKNVLTVKGLDAFEGTPVLDIKPYFHEKFDVKDVKVAEWSRKDRNQLDTKNG